MAAAFQLTQVAFAQADGLGVHYLSIPYLLPQQHNIRRQPVQIAHLRQPPPFLETEGVEQADAGVVVAEDDGDDVFDA